MNEPGPASRALSPRALERAGTNKAPAAEEERIVFSPRVEGFEVGIAKLLRGEWDWIGQSPAKAGFGEGHSVRERLLDPPLIISPLPLSPCSDTTAGLRQDEKGNYEEQNKDGKERKTLHWPASGRDQWRKRGGAG